MIDPEILPSNPEQQQVQQHSWGQIGLVALCSSILFVLFLRTFADPDLWGHLRFGLDLVAARGFVTTDPYSYLTAGSAWINHEWLTEVLMAGAWLGAGAPGLVALRMVLLAITLGLICFHLVWNLHLAFFPMLVVLLITLLGLLPFVRLVRPQLFTFLLFALTLIVIYQAEYGHYLWLWLMPPAVVAWVNLHGGFLAGCGIFGLWAIAHLAVHRDQWRVVGPPILATALATLVNPYGVYLISFLLQTATSTRPEIVDWRPLELATWFGVIYLAIIVVAGTALVHSRKPRRKILLSIYGLTTLMPLVAVRHLPLLAIAFSVLVAEHVGSAWKRRNKSRTERVLMRPWMAAAACLTAVVIVVSGIFSNGGQIEISDDLAYPAAAAKLLASSKVSGNLATDFDWGEFLIWHVGPILQVSIDGRRETIYPEDIYRKNLRLRYGRDRWDELLADHPTDAALVPQGSAADNLLRLYPGWQLVYEDDTSALFVNQQSPMAAPLQAAAAEFVAPPAQTTFP